MIPPNSPMPDEPGAPQADDWRLSGQEAHLANATLHWRRWRQTRPNWDHDHCAFCWAKFDETGSAESLREGYATDDEYKWVCQSCARDFAGRFGMRLIGGPHHDGSA